MKKLFLLSLMFGLLAPGISQAADRFEEKDFQWDPFFNLYKRVIIVGVNKIARENPQCATLDPKSLQHSGGTPDDPEFSVACGEGDHVTHARFSKADITGDPASNIPLEDKAAH
jgi:hypothetical protein